MKPLFTAFEQLSLVAGVVVIVAKSKVIRRTENSRVEGEGAVREKGAKRLGEWLNPKAWDTKLRTE